MESSSNRQKLAPVHRERNPQVSQTQQRMFVHDLQCVLQGKIRQDGSGLATFKATFQCICFRPFKGEVLDCAVSSVNKVSILLKMLIVAEGFWG